ncbi:MAG: hypothetical protein ACOCWQ_06110, partial [Nanoarchaeota archaeon]
FLHTLHPIQHTSPGSGQRADFNNIGLFALTACPTEQEPLTQIPLRDAQSDVSFENTPMFRPRMTARTTRTRSPRTTNMIILIDNPWARFILHQKLYVTTAP